MQSFSRATRSTSLCSFSAARSSWTILNDTGAIMPGSSGSGASATRIRCSRSASRPPRDHGGVGRPRPLGDGGPVAADPPAGPGSGGGSSAPKLGGIILHFPDFERTRVERVLLDEVFQRVSVAYRILLRGGHVPE